MGRRAKNQSVSALGRLHQRFGDGNSGAMAPRLMIYFRPSATDIFKRINFFIWNEHQETQRSDSVSLARKPQTSFFFRVDSDFGVFAGEKSE